MGKLKKKGLVRVMGKLKKGSISVMGKLKVKPNQKQNLITKQQKQELANTLGIPKSKVKRELKAGDRKI